jgi:O-antigen/teichoic acid export membrane protein
MNKANRIEKAKGSLYGLAFMFIEGVGTLVLSRALYLTSGKESVGQLSFYLYSLGLLNVLIGSLGVLTVRVLVGHSAQGMAGAFSSAGVEILDSIKRRLFWFVGVVGVIVCMFVPISASHTTQHINWIMAFFIIGFLMRGYGLTIGFRFLAFGSLGADRAYQALFSGIFFGGATALCALNGAGLLGVAGAYAGTGLFLGCWNAVRWRRYVRTAVRPDAAKEHVESAPGRRLPTPYRAYLLLVCTAFAGYATLNGDAFVVGTLLGPATLAEYGLMARLGTAVMGVATLYSSIQMQPIAAAYHSNNMLLSRRLATEGVFVGVGLSVLGGLCLYAVYPIVANWVLGDAVVLPRELVGFVCASALLTTFIGAHGWALMAVRSEALVWPTMVNAGTSIGFATLAGGTFGLKGILVGNMVGHVLSAAMHFFLVRNTFRSKC